MHGTVDSRTGSGSHHRSCEGDMDDGKEEKSVIEKVVDKINDVVESIANTASDAAAYAMESNTDKFAGKTDKRVYTPEVAEAIVPLVTIPMALQPDRGLAVARRQDVEEAVSTGATPSKKRAMKAKASADEGPN